ncbi:MAG: penicillin-binding protein [Bacilli bacterium]|nr:penicillin-binding protein [Bacilli bacterium]
MKNPRLKQRKIQVNVKKTMLIVGFFFCVIIVKLSYVVLSPEVDGIELREFADARNTTREVLYASRGIIYDVDGNSLAKNANSYRVIAILSPSRTVDEKRPMHVVDKDGTAIKLCEVLAKNDQNKEKCVNDLKEYFSYDRYQVELGNWGRISEEERQSILALDLPGVEFVTQSKKRQYINSSWASYILGYARSNDKGEINGEMGIESYYNDTLKGKDGFVEYQQDAYGYKMASSSEIREDAVPGSDVYLSISSDVQNALENAISKFSKDKKLEWAMFTVMDAKTGAILGAATNPNFNPNTLDNLTNYLNPLVGYQFEPGSTMKTFSWLAAMENGIYKGQDKYMSGTLTLSDGTRIKDFNNIGWGEITYDLGFAYSSNVAASNLGLALGAAKLNDYYNKCGFGKKTKITLPGEAEGIVDLTYDSEVASASFGQGVLVTPVQLMQAMSAMANDGVMVRPYIVSKVVDASGKIVSEASRVEAGRIASKENALAMKELLHDVVYNGFEYNKAYSPSNVEIVGKTGTAQIASPNGGYLTGEYDYIKSFLGLFPYEEPKYVFYFATKSYVGPSADLSNMVSTTIQDVASILMVSDKKSDMDASMIVSMDQYISTSTKDTVEKLKKAGVEPIVIGNGDYITNQFPLKETKVLKGSKVFLQTNSTEIIMPDVVGWSTNEIIRYCELIGLKYTLEGYGKVESVNIEKNTKIDLKKVTLNIKLKA